MSNNVVHQVDEDEIDLKELFGILVKHKFKIVFFMLLFGAAAAFYTYITPNTYSTYTTIEIDEQKNGSTNPEDMLSMAMGSSGVDVDTEIQILQSRSLISKVLKDVDFIHRYYEKYHLKEKELYYDSPFYVDLQKGESISFKVLPIDAKYYKLEAEGKDPLTLKKWKIEKIFAFNKIAETKYFQFTLKLKKGELLDKEKVYRFVVLRKRDAVNEVQKNLSVEQATKKSSVLKITYKDSVPLRAKEFADALAKAYLKQEIEYKTQEASMTLDFIDKQLAAINKSLQSSENALEAFKQKNNMVSLDAKAEDVVSKVSEYEGKLAEINIEDKMLSSLYRQIINGKNFDSISTAGLNLGQTGVPELIQKLQEATLQRKSLLADFTPQYPEVVKLTQSIKQYKKIIVNTIKALKLRVDKRKKLLQSAIEQYEKLVKVLPEKEKLLGGLERKFMANKKIYSYLFEKRAATVIAKTSTVNKSRIIDRALIPEDPIKPKRKLIIIVALVVGLIVGIFFVFLLEFMDDRIKDKEDIHNNSSLPLLGTIPFIKNEQESIVLFDSPKSVASEAFRALRANLQFIRHKDDTMLLAVTSTVGGEGKTTVSSNLAAAISLTDKKTIILNMDLRKPTLHQRFGLPNNKGMSSLLAGHATLEEVIQKSKHKNLDVISSGPVPSNPSELIASEAMIQVVEELKREYEVIIFDTPPVGLVADALTLLHLCDAVFYVVRSNYSRKIFLRDLERLVKEHNMKNVNIVLNGMKANKSGYGGYGYGNGYGYYSEEK